MRVYCQQRKASVCEGELFECLACAVLPRLCHDTPDAQQMQLGVTTLGVMMATDWISYLHTVRAVERDA